MERLLCMMIGYGCGNFLTAYFVVKMKLDKSIFMLGSGNPGMTNTIRVLGKKYGSIVLAGDLSKTILAYLIGLILVPKERVIVALYTGIGTVLGHNYPIWYHFHGGKGVATTCMALVLVDPIIGISSCLLGLIVVVLVHSLAYGAVIIPMIFWISTCFGQNRESSMITGLLSLLMLVKHRKGLWDGKEKDGGKER
ncbi:acyl-phosphate:glycerol-3-phosphate O-acyltransferase PlsY [Lachnospiraceae bacterium KM106-2]|nr:acyl-phosphate:glycerol-3-phosphate O-acyltransferase PlsY [Lachnospiraceae bacterium KM106-2]